MRGGRITVAQRQAISSLMPRYGLEIGEIEAKTKMIAVDYPINLEVGFGNGENLLHMAEQNPKEFFTGCEVHRPGLGHALLEIAKRDIPNVLLVEGDALDFLRRCFRSALHCVYVFFPDPWPKKKHRKRRLISSEYLNLLGNTFHNFGRLYFATDVESYFEQVLGLMETTEGWRSLSSHRLIPPRFRKRLVTRFESKALELRKPVFELSAAYKNSNIIR